MFGSIRKLMSNVMPQRPAPRPPPARQTGWSDRSGFTPSVRADRRAGSNPSLVPDPPALRRATPSAPLTAPEAGRADAVSAPVPEEILKLTADWLTETAYSAAEVLAAMAKEAAQTEREKQILIDAKIFQDTHNVPELAMMRSLETLRLEDFRRHTNDGDPVIQPQGG